MVKFHYINKKFYITTNQRIKSKDLYLDRLVHPSLIEYPLVMREYTDNTNMTIISISGTTSPVSTSRKIVLIIG